MSLGDRQTEGKVPSDSDREDVPSSGVLQGATGSGLVAGSSFTPLPAPLAIGG
uniref:Uncharacterized protein n=1 Tax=Arundo donax TaxID=35708 RepID=A0A0A8Y8S3_ARUDO